MKQRIITALVLAPLAILGIFQLPFLLFIFLVSAIVGLGIWEWTQFVATDKRGKHFGLMLFVAILTLLLLPVDPLDFATFNQSSFPIVVSGVIWWLIASLLAITYPTSTKHWAESPLLKAVFAWLSLIPFIWSIVALRAVNYEVDSYYGAKLVMFVCLLVWAADSGAYFAGKSFGKHKMAPKVSPNKTIEGLVGGVIVAILVGWGSAYLMDLRFSSFGVMLITILLTVVISVMGDLVESMLKRTAQIKDSSNLIPGHGGVLDRIDSLIAAFPIFALLYFLLA